MESTGLKPESPFETAVEKPQNPWNKIEVIPKDAKDFQSKTTGKWYFIERDISNITLERYQQLEKLLAEYNFSMTSEWLESKLVEQASHFNNSNYVASMAINHNLLQSVADQRAKDIITFWIASVFIVREDENPFEWDKVFNAQKINDWKQNFDSGFFLDLKTEIVGELSKYLKVISQTFSQTTSEDIAKTEAVQKKYEVS